MAPTRQSAKPTDWRKLRSRWLLLHEELKQATEQVASIQGEIKILAALMEFDARAAAAIVEPVQSDHDDNLLTECEAARHCKVSKGTIRRWRKEGVKGPDGQTVARLPHSKAGNRPRYTKKQLDRWMARRKQRE